MLLSQIGKSLALFCCFVFFGLNDANAQSGSISSNSPCQLGAGQSACSVNLSWSKSNTPIACLWLSTGSLFACSGNGSDSAVWPHANLIPDVFVLRAHSSWTTVLVSDPELARITVRASPPVVAAYQATYLNQSVPTTMTAGQTYAASVTMRNDGSDTWSAAQYYRLGSQNPQDNSTWGLGRVDTTGQVGPGQQATFSFNVTAPSSPGTYNFQWRMVRDGVTWFGPQTANVTVTVVSAAPQVAPTCSSVAPSVTTTNATTGSLRVYAYGVSNATSVFFPTWGDTGGQDDIGWYQGINAGNGTWYADVNLANHKAGNPEFGTFNTHVHMHNAAYSYVWCGATNWTRTAPTPAALCALALSVPLQLTPAENISWAGCGNTGVGVQSALDLVTSLGGGEVKLTGAGSILVGSPLKVGNRTLVYGDLSRLPYGMQLIGNQCGGSPIQRECPVISINSQSISGTSNNNVEIRNIEIAAHPTYPNRGEVISIRESNRVLLENVKIDGAVRMGVAVYRSANVAIRNLNLTMVRWPSQPSLEGGAGVWIFGSTNTLLENSTITSPEYYASGLPKPDPRSAVTAALTMDLVAAYASQGTRIQGNTITYGNTAGIYIACQADTAGCETARTARDVGAVVWNNTVRFFRQHGLDIASSDGTQVVTNRVSDIGDAALALADVTQSTVQYNTLERAQLNAQPHSLRGTLLLLWGAKNNNITYNTVVGDTNTEYAVAFSDSGSAAFGFCTSNNVSSNNLWRGRLGHIGGTLSGNVVSPNQTY